MDDQQIAERVSGATAITGKPLTIQQEAYIYSLLSDENLSEQESARMAGFQDVHGAILRLRQNPTVVTAIRGHLVAQFQTLAVKAVRHYARVLDDPRASQTAKNQAAEAVLNRAGILQAKPSADGEKDLDNRELSELSIPEIEAMIKGLELTKAGRADIVDGEVVEETLIESIP
jgi:hypothetical protein